MWTHVGHVAINASGQDKHNETAPTSLALFNRELLAKTCWRPRVTPMTSMNVTDQRLHPDHQQWPNITQLENNITGSDA